MINTPATSRPQVASPKPQLLHHRHDHAQLGYQGCTYKLAEMTTSAPTIIDLKTSFLRSQILLLSQPLHPSPEFLTSISGEENALRQKSIDEALYKLNGLLKKHNKLSYGPQALRHVAEQVDRLYWNSGERGAVGEGEEWAEKGADLRESLNCFLWVVRFGYRVAGGSFTNGVLWHRQ